MSETEQTITARLHERLLNRASVHFVLASEETAPGNPMAVFDERVGNVCVGLAKLVASVDRSIDHTAELITRNITVPNRTARY